MSAEPTSCPKRFATILVFRSKIFFYDFSISEDRTGETEVSAAPTSCPERFDYFRFLVQNIFFAISLFLKVAQTRWRFQRHLQAALNGLQPFSFNGPKKFFTISPFLKVA